MAPVSKPSLEDEADAIATNYGLVGNDDELAVAIVALVRKHVAAAYENAAQIVSPYDDSGFLGGELLTLARKAVRK